MVTERKPELSQEKRAALGADLRILEVDNLREIEANYHQFAEAVKPILKQGAAKLVEHGIFPEERVADGKTVQILDVGYEEESSTRRVVIDPEGLMYICNQIKTDKGPGWTIHWNSREDASDEDYVDFALQALHKMANEFREALGMDRMSNPIPFHSRW